MVSKATKPENKKETAPINETNNEELKEKSRIEKQYDNFSVAANKYYKRKNS